jgi:paraquat-inducible protein A
MDSWQRVRKGAGALLLLLSLACLWPGLTLPVLTVQAKIDLSVLGPPFSGRFTLMEEELSVLEAIANLYGHGMGWLATLLLGLAVLLPTANIAVQCAAIVLAQGRTRKRLRSVAAQLSKWAMAEVFAAALVLACWSVDAQRWIQAGLGAGFYGYLAHVLAALVGSFLLDQDDQADSSSVSSPK